MKSHDFYGHDLNDAELGSAAQQRRHSIMSITDLLETGWQLHSQGQLQEAESFYRQALTENPDHAAALCYLGMTLNDQGRLDDAVTAYSRSIELDPKLAAARNNLANTLALQGRLAEAVAGYNAAIRLQPDFAETYNGLGNVFARLGQLDNCLGALQRAAKLQPDSPIFDGGFLASLAYSHRVSKGQLWSQYRRWVERHAGQIKPKERHGNSRDLQRRLRVGYVSPDMSRLHPIAHFFLPALACHDHAQFEITIYADVVQPDTVTADFQRHADRWHSAVGLNDEQLAEKVQADEIDILVDLAGFTARNRLLMFARKPAPIQVTWLGCPNTTGMKAIDYRITDAAQDPPGELDPGSEEPVRLSRGTACYVPRGGTPDVTPPPALSLGHITFGSFHRPVKINTDVIELWSRVLKAVPTARLLLFHHTYVDQSKQMLHRAFATQGIPAERITVRSERRPGGHLAEYRDVDISLDSFPFTGYTTACESVWMGVPYLTLPGDRPTARGGAWVDKAIGHPEWIAASSDNFVQIAAALAGNLPHLEWLRKELRNQAEQTIGNAVAFTRELEAAYRTMWRKWCAIG